MLHDIAAALPWSRQLSQLKATTKQLQTYLRQDQAAYVLRGSLFGAPHLQLDVYFEGPSHMLADVERLLFSECLMRKNLIDTGYSAAQIALMKRSCDISFRCTKPWGRLQPGSFPFKFWLNAKMRPRPVEELKLSKDFRRALQRAQNSQFQIQKTKDFSTWQWWLENLVIPTAKLRHGTHMALPDIEEMRGLAEDGELILISHNDEIVAGALVYMGRLNRNLFVWRVGMSEKGRQDTKLYKSLNVYLDFLAYQQAIHKGAEWFNLGPTLARVDSGLYRYKTSWGCGFYDDPCSLLFEMNLATAKRTEILQHVPLISLDKDQTVFHFNETKNTSAVTSIPNLKAIYYHNGISLRQELLDV
ncbi:MAG: hypothetical protein ACOH5I_18905 [Oligoflexus sp.]